MTVEGHELRNGDVIVMEVGPETNVGAREVLGHWGNTKVYRNEKGQLYWKDFLEPNYDMRFSSGYFFNVVDPRPEPEVNEFGPVSP